MNILIAGCTVLPMTASEADAHKYFTGNIGIADGRIAFCRCRSAAGGGIPCPLRDIAARDRRPRQGGDAGPRQPAQPCFNEPDAKLCRRYAADAVAHRKIWPFEAKLDGEDIYLGARLGIAEMLLGGTTTFVDMYWHSDRVADAVTETRDPGCGLSDFRRGQL